MITKKGKEYNEKITITIQPDILKEYREYCEVNGMSVSKRVNLLMKEDLKTKRTKKNENTINK